MFLSLRLLLVSTTDGDVGELTGTRDMPARIEEKLQTME